MRLYEFKNLKTSLDVDMLYKECRREATRLYQKYLEDKKLDPTILHPADILEKEVDRLLNDYRR